jgi:hypothetical protein
MQLQSQFVGKPPVARALTVSPADEDIIVGTSTCDILEVNENGQACLFFLLHAVLTYYHDSCSVAA